MGRGGVAAAVALSVLAAVVLTLAGVAWLRDPGMPDPVGPAVCRPASEPSGVTRWCAQLHHADPVLGDPVDELWLVATVGSGKPAARYYVTDLPFRTDEPGVVVAFVPGGVAARDRSGLTVRVPDEAYRGVLD